MERGCFSSDFMFRTRNVYEALSVKAGINIVKYRASLETSRVVPPATVPPQRISRIHCNTESGPEIWKADVSRRISCSELGMSMRPYRSKLG